MISLRPIVPAASAVILTLAVATGAYAAAPRAARSASAGPTVNLVAAARGCAVVHIALHGAKAPTITCLRPASSRPASPRPGSASSRRGRTGQPVRAGRAGSASYRTPGGVPCNGTQELEINTYSATYCWSGSGYLGLNPTLAQVMVISAVYPSWVRLYYNGAGTYFNVASGGVDEFFIGPTGAPQNVVVSQVDINEGYHS